MEKAIEILTPPGIVDGFFYKPDEPGAYPGVLFLTDIGGIRDANRSTVSRLAQAGYIVLMPNLFYRTGRPPVMPPFSTLKAEDFAKYIGALAGPLTPEAIASDGVSYVNALLSEPGVLPDSKIGIVGFCYSGAMALRIAASEPDTVAAVASFHGGRLYLEGDPSSPHLLLPKIKAALLFGHADQDRSMDAEAIKHFEKALREWGGEYESELYPGAHHGWTVPDHSVYNLEQAERAFAKLTAFLAAKLK